MSVLFTKSVTKCHTLLQMSCWPGWWHAPTAGGKLQKEVEQSWKSENWYQLNYEYKGSQFNTASLASPRKPTATITLQKRQAHHDKVPTGLYQCANVLFRFVFVPRLSAWERGYLLAQGKLLGPMTLLSVAHNNTSTQCSLPANSSLTVLELCELLQK